MDNVVDELFVGTIENAGDEKLLSDFGIEHIISLTHSEPDGGFPSDLMVKKIPLRGGPRNDLQTFERPVSHALSCLKADDKLLVHCSAGASRSPAVAATGLILYKPVGLEAAFEQIATRRNAVNPHEALVRQAAHVYNNRSE